MASRGLEFLGLDAGEPGLVELVTKELSPVHGNPAERERRAGECLYRHLTGSVEQVKIMLPPLPEVAEAITTTPGTVDRHPVELHPAGPHPGGVHAAGLHAVDGHAVAGTGLVGLA
jgi:hypothetical protein